MKNYIYALIGGETYVFESHEEYHLATFDPSLDIQFVCGLRLGAYAKGKERARDKAIEWQYIISDNSICMSYGELAVWQDLFVTLGKKYGLMREFHENCIC